jgi:hypothetical protein
MHRYEAGETTQQIGNRYGISKTRVATVLHEQGVTIRRQGLTDKQVSEAARLYTDGQSLARLGARYNASQTTVATALRRQGVQLRPRPGWTVTLAGRGARHGERALCVPRRGHRQFEAVSVAWRQAATGRSRDVGPIGYEIMAQQSVRRLSAS